MGKLPMHAPSTRPTEREKEKELIKKKLTDFIWLVNNKCKIGFIRKSVSQYLVLDFENYSEDSLLLNMLVAKDIRDTWFDMFLEELAKTKLKYIRTGDFITILHEGVYDTP